MNNIKKDPGFYIFWCIAISIGIWCMYRTYILSITNDEAYSFYNVSTGNWKMMCGTANTHWLNTIFIFFETKLIGNQEWMIRIHSCIAYFALAWFLYKISVRFISSYWQLLIPLAVILLNGYLLDFFSLARGYGISVMFETIALYYILISDESVKKRFLIYLFLALATFSCYTAIFILAAYFMHDSTAFFLNKIEKKISWKEYFISIIPFIGISIVAIPNILFIRTQGDLEEGQANGFIADTLGVFFERSYQTIVNENIAFYISITLFNGIVFFYFFFRNEIDKKVKKLFEIFFINVLIIEALFIFLNIPYTFGRTALYIMLLVLILLVYVFIFLTNKILKAGKIIFCFSLFVFSASHFIFFKNHLTTTEWWKTQGLENCIRDLEKTEGEKMYQKKIGMHLAQIGVYNNYYNYLHKSHLNDTVFSFCENKRGVYDFATIQKMLIQDYLIMLKPYHQIIDTSKIIVLKRYKEMNADLIKLNK